MNGLTLCTDSNLIVRHANDPLHGRPESRQVLLVGVAETFLVGCQCLVEVVVCVMRISTCPEILRDIFGQLDKLASGFLQLRWARLG